MIVTGESLSTGRETCHSDTLCAKKLYTDLESNPGGRGERPNTNRLNHCTAQKIKTYVNTNLRPSPYRAVNTLRLVIKTNQLMLCREIIAVCSQIHTKHINTLCGQNVELYIKTQSVPRSKHTPSRL